MNLKKSFQVTLFGLLIIFGILFLINCAGHFTVRYVPSDRLPSKETEKEQPVSKEKKQQEIPVESSEKVVVQEQDVSVEEINEKSSPSQEKKEQLETSIEETEKKEKNAKQIIVKEEETGEKTKGQKKLTSGSSSEQKKEGVIIEGNVRLEKNNYYVLDLQSHNRYMLVGLTKEEKNRLNNLLNSTVRIELRIISTQPKKAYNAQLIKILEEITTPQEIDQNATSEKEKLEKKQKEKIEVETSKQAHLQEKSEEKQHAEEEVHEGKDVGSKSEEVKPVRVIVQGVVSIHNNNYFVFDFSSKIRYTLIGLKKEEMNKLRKLNKNEAKLEIKIISRESEREYKAQLIRFY